MVQGTYDTSRSDFFTESGIGGNSTFVVTQPGNYIATPQVRFAKALHKFVLVYPAKILYASAVGRGDDPTILGSDFYVYFVTGQVFQFQNIWTGPNGTFVREEVIVGRKTHQGPGSDEDGEGAQQRYPTERGIT